MFTFIRIYWRAITLLVLACITTLSLLPVEQLPIVSGSDKIHHFLAYGFLTLPVAIKKPKHWQIILLSFVFYSGIIELIQGLFGRNGEWLDLVANGTGILSGLALAQVILMIKKQWTSKKISDLAD